MNHALWDMRFDLLLAFVKEIAAEKCYQNYGEYPELFEGEKIDCRSCQARQIIRAIGLKVGGK